MKTFNVALLSDDTTMKPNYFFIVKADNPFNAIDKATNQLRRIFGSDLNDFTPEIFELVEI